MKNIQNNLIVLLLVSVIFPQFASAQGRSNNELQYEVQRVYPTVSITKEALSRAETLLDLNPQYKKAWVKKYISVELLASCNGNKKKAVYKNDVLSPKQKNIINTADENTDITIRVRYLPNNNLKHNEVQEINFSFTVEPKSEAIYSNREQELQQYLKENAINQISEASFDREKLAVVKFTIDEKGQVENAHVLYSSEDKKVDQLLLETVSKMKNWKAAECSNGTKVKQEFVLTVGNMESCLMNLLNIRQDLVVTKQ